MLFSHCRVFSHCREGYGRDSQGRLCPKGSEDGSKAAGVLGSPPRCQHAEQGKSGADLSLERDIRASLRPVVIQHVYCDESKSHQEVQVWIKEVKYQVQV